VFSAYTISPKSVYERSSLFSSAVILNIRSLVSSCSLRLGEELRVLKKQLAKWLKGKSGGGGQGAAGGV
jgi:hypothetical protein